MICKRLFEYVSSSSGEIENAFYKYGIECGKKMQLDFNKIHITLNKLKIKTIDKDAHLKTIMKGFCEGLRKT